MDNDRKITVQLTEDELHIIAKHRARRSITPLPHGSAIIGGVVVSAEELASIPVGKDYPEGGGFSGYVHDMLVYVGKQPNLQGELAAVYALPGQDVCYAQFNHPRTKRCFGWWRFAAEDFESCERENAS
jgi:hypothetical protein